MARCPKLDTKESGFFTTTVYVCELTGVEMDEDSPKVKLLCKCDGYEYENCPIYKDR